MDEQLDIFDLKGNFLKTQARKEYFKQSREEFAKTGKVSTRLRSVRLIILNSEGRIYLQKRSRSKPENGGLYDKTVGGHLSSGDDWEMTVIRECAEELGIPVAILNQDEFQRSAKTTDLKVVGIVKKLLGPENYDSERHSISGEKYIQPYSTCFYFGYYDGALRFVDGESCGIEVFSIEELEEEIEARPDAFTQDLKFMFEKFRGDLMPLSEY